MTEQEIIPRQLQDDVSKLIQALTLKTLRDIDSGAFERIENLIQTNFQRLHEELKHMSAQLELLNQKVTEQRSVIDSAITLLNGLSILIMSLKDDPVALAQLATDIGTSTQLLSEAVTINTPAEGQPQLMFSRAGEQPRRQYPGMQYAQQQYGQQPSLDQYGRPLGQPWGQPGQPYGQQPGQPWRQGQPYSNPQGQPNQPQGAPYAVSVDQEGRKLDQYGNVFNG